MRFFGILSASFLLSFGCQHPPSLQIDSVIAQAGNTENEKDRYRLLKQLRDQISFESPIRRDLDKLLPVIDRWANGRDKYWQPGDKTLLAHSKFLGGFFSKEVLPALPVLVDRDSSFYPFWFLIQFYFENVKYIYPPEVPKYSPLYPIWCMYRGRMLIQQPIQDDPLKATPALRDAYYGQGRRLLQIASTAFPKNRTIRMYLDEPVPWPPIHPHDPNAPDWANHQREALEKLTDIITFWIDERQAPDGQLGGGWGDDVEMWRTWTPVLIGFDDPKINAAQAKLSNGLFALERMAGGYTSNMSDVEHTGEDSGDSGTAMMHVAPDDPIWQARAQRLGDLMQNLWTGRNERGFLQFKSTFFTSHEVDASPFRACDTVYHPRAVQPLLLYWQRTGDPQITALISAWMDTWVDAAARAERGKPAGIIPSAIHWPDGRIGGLGKRWWVPENYGEEELYAWPSAMQMMTSTLLLTYHMTGKETYLAPIQSMADIRLAYLTNPLEDPQKGSAMWCASKMKGFLSDALSKYRLLSNDTSFDTLLHKDADGYVQFRLSGNRQRIETDLQKTAEASRVNRPAYTDEVRWTDRLFAFAENYANDYADPPLPQPDLHLLYKTVTGDFGNPLYFPMNAVRWKTPSQNIAALVTDHSTQHLTAELYHFGSEQRTMGAEFFLLEKGDYIWSLKTDAQTISSGAFTIDKPRTAIGFTLPSQKLCTLTVQKQESP